MWARAIEIAVSLWLFASLFVLDVGSTAFAWCVAFAAAAVLAFAVCALTTVRLQRIHLASPFAALFIFFSAHLLADPKAPFVQSAATASLLILMFAIVPTRSTIPPKGWETFNRGGRGASSVNDGL